MNADQITGILLLSRAIRNLGLTYTQRENILFAEWDYLDGNIFELWEVEDNKFIYAGKYE